MATRSERWDENGNRVPFSNAVSLGWPVNTKLPNLAASIDPAWPAAGSKLYYSRCNLPDCNDLDIYEATWHPDCNGNGKDDLEEIASGDVEDANGDGIPDDCAGAPVSFRRGDCNDDGTVDIADAVCTLEWLFLVGEAPQCIAAANTNGDESVDIGDPVYSLWFFFAGGPDPVQPFPICGRSLLEADIELGCEAPPKNCPQ